MSRLIFVILFLFVFNAESQVTVRLFSVSYLVKGEKAYMSGDSLSTYLDVTSDSLIYTCLVFKKDSVAESLHRYSFAIWDLSILSKEFDKPAIYKSKGTDFFVLFLRQRYSEKSIKAKGLCLLARSDMAAFFTVGYHHMSIKFPDKKRAEAALKKIKSIVKAK